MQQRTSGRPSGTDGFDFSYRMVVDPRYKNVAKLKDRLRAVLVAQAIIQLFGMLWIFSSTFGKKDRQAMITLAFGLLSLVFGELGRRRSRVGFLGLYATTTFLNVGLSIGDVVRTGVLYTVIRDGLSWNFETCEASCVLLGILLQAFGVWTSYHLRLNMSPKRTS
ncbi:hypothetical protein QJS10_CPA01g02698 [Acorus calamus]|uniref:Uncharacterized protein n=1 Tax=Acorus calamus TaxID=4465 RepID=A0AAV9FUN4_ACOCL|nr:hypothetical protein QJS10_CPA01g02698 [Acorus calamus]